MRITEPKDFYFEPKSYHEALFFGEINAVKKGKKRLLFRPSQYRLKPCQTFHLSLEVKYLKSLFFGDFTLGLFRVNRENILLMAKEGTAFSEISIIFVEERYEQ